MIRSANTKDNFGGHNSSVDFEDSRGSRKGSIAGAAALVMLAGTAATVWQVAAAGASTPSQESHTGYALSAHAPSIAGNVAAAVIGAEQRVVTVIKNSHAVVVRVTKPVTAPAPKPTPKPATTTPAPKPASTPAPKPSTVPTSKPAPVAASSTSLVTRYFFNASVKVPQSWIGVTCGTKAATGFCTTTPTTGTGEEVYYNPADKGQRVTISDCFGHFCAGQKDTTHPTLKMLFPVSSQSRLSFYELGFNIDSAARFGAYPVDGVLAVAHMGFELAWPMDTVTVSVPASQHSVATAILDSVVVSVPAGCGG